MGVSGALRVHQYRTCTRWWPPRLLSPNLNYHDRVFCIHVLINKTNINNDLVKLFFIQLFMTVIVAMLGNASIHLEINSISDNHFNSNRSTKVIHSYFTKFLICSVVQVRSFRRAQVWHRRVSACALGLYNLTTSTTVKILAYTYKFKRTTSVIYYKIFLLHSVVQTGMLRIQNSYRIGYTLG